jgi:hypothetical protein
MESFLKTLIKPVGTEVVKSNIGRFNVNANVNSIKSEKIIII